MPITFPCDCGRRLRVADEYAGKRALCPSCGNVLSVPAARPDDEDEPVERKPRKKLVQRTDDEDAPKRASTSRTEDGEVEDRPRRRSAPEEVRFDFPRKVTGDEGADRKWRGVRSGSRETERDDRATARGGSTWRFSWNPLIGIMYGPIPVGLIVVGIIMLISAVLGLRK